MSGILNETGAVSGVLGTTVGTPAATTAATLGAGVLPVGITGGSGLTALGTVTAGNISHADIVYPVGHILQVKSTFVTARNSSGIYDTSGTGADCGLNVTITPVSTTSDFLISLSIGVWGSPDSNSIGMILSKDGAKIGNGGDSGSRNGAFCRGVKYSWNDTNHCDGASAQYLDTVSGSGSRVYKCGLVCQVNGNTAYINRNGSNSDSDTIHGSYTGSSLTVMEIQGS
jgi:hypothetical protein